MLYSHWQIGVIHHHVQTVFSALLILSTALLFAVELPAQSRTKIVVGYASMSSVATTLWVAQDKGFFAKNGLDVQSIFIPGSPTLIATLNTGDVHLGYTAARRLWAPPLAGWISR